MRYLFPSSYHSPVLLDRRSVEQPRPDEQEEPEETHAAVSRTARRYQLFVCRELSLLDILLIPVPTTIYPRPDCDLLLYSSSCTTDYSEQNVQLYVRVI